MKNRLIIILVLLIFQGVQAQHSRKLFEQPFELSSIQLKQSPQSYGPQLCENYLQFLETQFPTDKKVRITEEELHSLKNDVADKLLAQSNLPDNFDQRFLAMLDTQLLCTESA